MWFYRVYGSLWFRAWWHGGFEKVVVPREDSTRALRIYHMGSCPNYGPFSGTLNNRCRIIIGTQKGTIILTTTHMYLGPSRFTFIRFRDFRVQGFTKKINQNPPSSASL